MGIRQYFQVLGFDLQQGALGVEHLQKTEFAEFEPFDGSVVGALSTRNDLCLQGRALLYCCRETFDGLGELVTDRSEFLLRLVRHVPCQCGEEPQADCLDCGRTMELG